MADKDRFLEEEESPAQGDEAEVGKRVGLFPSLLLKILKWVAIVIAFILLTVLVTVLMWRALVGNSTAISNVPAAPEDIIAAPMNLIYFKNVGQIRGQTSDVPPASFIASIELGYDAGNNSLTAEINEKASLIHNRVLIYLSKKSWSELHPKNAEKLQNELEREINRLLRTGKIQQVIFDELQAIGS
ncbi:MAG: flagellar basal body-associated FliL family protein [Spirochaetales bacterium]|nr:flagellar basal body-associated FliL family protein [Spirochaetales bacterium]